MPRYPRGVIQVGSLKRGAERSKSCLRSALRYLARTSDKEGVWVCYPLNNQFWVPQGKSKKKKLHAHVMQNDLSLCPENLL